MFMRECEFLLGQLINDWVKSQKYEKKEEYMQFLTIMFTEHIVWKTEFHLFKCLFRPCAIVSSRVE